MTDVSEVRELLRHIPCSQCTHNEWVNVGMALHKEGLPLSLWDEWSSTDPQRYHQGECEKRWRTFGNYGGKDVSMGSIYFMAQNYGWSPVKSMKTYGWDDMITADEERSAGWHHDETVQDFPKLQENEYSAIRDITDYLNALFEPEEKVCIVTTASKDESGKWRPYGGSSSRTCKQLLDSLEKHPEISDTFGTLNEDSGVWVCFNPMDGSGRKNSSVTSFRYALVESDEQDIETQYALLQDLKLPIKVLVHSGGKSLHAIVHIGAVDYKQYQERVDYLYTVCRKRGLVVDTQDKNPARLSRMPGFKRGDKWQYIVGRDMGLSDWVEWNHYIEDEMVDPLPVTNLGDIWYNMPPLKPELIEGVLRQSHKMLLVSSSKAGKTFALIELAIAIAEGRRWFGFRCKQGRVLYLNMELDEASFDDRMKKVYEKLELSNMHPDNIDIVHLRGKIEKLDKIVPQINRTLKTKEYAAVILDPTYKLGIGDENAAEQVTLFCNAIDKIANCGASVIYAHHHSKGAQGSKSSMDRASGSGVFARDADALLDMIELRIPGARLEEAKAEYGEKVTAWRMEATLREFQRIEPVNVFFSYPVHELDASGILDEANLEENERSMENGREIGSLSNKVKRELNIRDLAKAMARDEEFGRQKTQKEYADEFGVSERTIRSWMKEIYSEKQTEV